MEAIEEALHLPGHTAPAVPATTTTAEAASKSKGAPITQHFYLNGAPATVAASAVQVHPQLGVWTIQSLVDVPEDQFVPIRFSLTLTPYEQQQQAGPTSSNAGAHSAGTGQPAEPAGGQGTVAQVGASEPLLRVAVTPYGAATGGPAAGDGAQGGAGGGGVAEGARRAGELAREHASGGVWEALKGGWARYVSRHPKRWLTGTCASLAAAIATTIYYANAYSSAT